MDSIVSFYESMANTKALEMTSGYYETIFFEHVYRVTYLAGLSTTDRSIPYRLYGFMAKLMIAIIIICEVWDFLSDSVTLDGTIDSINITFIQFIAVYKFKSMNDNKKIFRTLAGAMESKNFNTNTVSRKKLLEMWTLRNERYIKLVIGLGFCTLIVWNIYPLVDELEYNLAVAVRIPFEYKTKERYPIVYILVQVAFSYVAAFVMVVDITMLTHLMLLLCQYTVLADCFTDILVDCRVGFEGIHLNKLLTDKRFCAKYEARLGDLVAQHILILNNTMELKKILSRPMLGQMATSLILISSLGYQVATTVGNVTKFLMSCLFLGYNMFELFIICRWCDDIRFQSENIRDAVYFSGWECGLSTMRGVRSQLIFVMLRASKPLVLTAGGMYDLSLVSFSNLVKTSYSALTVLLRLR